MRSPISSIAFLRLVLARSSVTFLTCAALISAARAQPRGAEASHTTAAEPAGPRTDEQSTASTATPSTSVGSPTSGRLENGVELVDSRVVFVKMGSEGTHHGTEETVRMVERAATTVAIAHPGPRLMVGDISRRRGGRLAPHSSHRVGRDVDLGFYLLSADGTPYVARSFVELSPRGHGRDRTGGDVSIDLVRCWALLEAIATDPLTRVQFILVAPSIRRLLLAHAHAAGADAVLLARIELLTESRSGSSSHDSHFHVRVFCSEDDEDRCLDAPPYHPWAFRDEAHAEARLASYRRAGAPESHTTRRRARRRRRARSAMRAAMRGAMVHVAMSQADDVVAMDGASMDGASIE